MWILSAWLLFFLFSWNVLSLVGWISGSAHPRLLWVTIAAAFLVWLGLLGIYRKRLKWIRRMADTLQVNPDLSSYQKVRQKWRRMIFQLVCIILMVGALLVHHTLQALKIADAPQDWVYLGIWMVWMHCLLWFTLAWNRDQSVFKRLEQEVYIELQSDPSEKDQA